MKENNNANSNKNINNTVDTKRNSDIISIERTNNMNNIDLNTVTVAEAKAAGITGMDLLKVLRNPVNAVVTKKNEEFAANLEAKTAKPVRKTNPKKYSATPKAFTKRLNWQTKVEGVTNLTAFFNGLKELLGSDIRNWNSMSDYNDSILLVMDEVFADIDVTDHTADHIVLKAKNWINNLKAVIKWSKEDRTDIVGDTSSTFWHAYRHPVTAADEAGLITNEESKSVLGWIDGLK